MNNYVVIQDWMLDFDLTPRETLIYALIYGFSQDRESYCFATLDYLQKWGQCTRPTLFKALDELLARGLIEKEQKNPFGRCAYRAIERGKETLPLGREKGKETLPNNKINNNTPSNTTTYNANALFSVVSSPPRGEDTENKPKKPTVADLEAEFEEVWSIYPLKAGKKRARAAYIAARRNKVSREDIEKGAKAYAEFVRESGTEQRYIKHGSTWFNGRCWEDKLAEVPERANAKPKGKPPEPRSVRALNYKQHHYTFDQLKAAGIDFGLDIYKDDTNENPSNDTAAHT